MGAQCRRRAARHQGPPGPTDDHNSGGDLHQAIVAGAMTESGVHADLARVVARRHAPIPADAIVVFDSTGVALEDAAAADLVYERARRLGLGGTLSLAS
jgi:ornithine cyclodeaminase/alanine dehydrogenase-like protein (mu-crystallin family)